jgi:hypothetical protein
MVEMTEDEFRKLQPGDLVAHLNGNEIMVVTANYGNRVTAVSSVDLTNPEEWILVAKPASNVEHGQ